MRDWTSCAHGWMQLFRDLLPAYQPQHVRPFRFLAQKDEFVESFSVSNQVPDIVKQGFAIRPRFELEARTIELVENQIRVVVAMSVAMQWEITAELAQLAKLSLSLEGLYVLRRNPQPGERRLIGRIKALHQDIVELDECADASTSISQDLVRLEGNKTSFKRCLSHLLGPRYRKFDEERCVWEARFTSGPSFDEVLGKFSRAPRTVRLGPNISAAIGPAIPIQNSVGAPVYREIPPVEYCFDAAKTKRKTIPWDGLVEFGPYDSDTFEKRSPRILVIVPQSEQNKSGAGIRNLSGWHTKWPIPGRNPTIIQSTPKKIRQMTFT